MHDDLVNDHVSWREGQTIAAVSLVSFVVAGVVAGGVAFAGDLAGIPWWVVTPVVYGSAYFTARWLLRLFFVRHFSAS